MIKKNHTHDPQQKLLADDGYACLGTQISFVAGQAKAANAQLALAAMASDEISSPTLVRAAKNMRISPQKTKITKITKRTKISDFEFMTRLAELPKRGIARTSSYILSFSNIANSLHLPYQVALDVFSNGRAYSQIGEEHAAILMGFQLHSHKDVRGSDGFHTEPGTGKKLLVSVKSAARSSVKFQLSVYTGGGRPACTEQNLLDSIALAHSIVVVDIQSFPNVRITEFPAQCATDWVKAKILSPNGFSAERFYLACGASCSSIEMGAYDFSKEFEALSKANSQAEKDHLASCAPFNPNPFVPSLSLLDAVSAAKAKADRAIKKSLAKIGSPTRCELSKPKPALTVPKTKNKIGRP